MERPFGRQKPRGSAGKGTISGDMLHGSVRWANYPRRREDGVWTPNLEGDRGRRRRGVASPCMDRASGKLPDAARRAILTRVELLNDHERYRWLNASFVVGEGEIDEDTEAWWVQSYVCINEVIEHPPAIGAMPPPRFRQADR